MNCKNNSEFAQDIFEEFQNKSGSHAIAKLEALSVIEFFTRYWGLSRSYNILEIGGGLGTITKLLLKCTESKIYVQELNEFCQSELRKLEFQYPSRVKISLGIENQSYEMIIIDGPYNLKELGSAIKISEELKIIIIESGRVKSRIEVLHLVNKFKFRVQYLEFRNNSYNSAAAVFLLEKNPKQRKRQLRFDFLFIYLRLMLKYRLLVTNHPDSKFVGSWPEDERGIHS